MLKLASATDPAWAEWAATQLDEILLDHAHCEKKAAGMAVTLIFQYPEHEPLMAPLSELAREELGHFEAVLRELAQRGLAFRRQRPSPYAGRLRRLVRAEEPGRLVDTLLCCAVVEARSCERLGLLAEALLDPALRSFYAALHRAEARHHGIYLDLACRVEPRQQVVARLEEVMAHEAEVLRRAPVAARLHDQHEGGSR